MLGVRHCPSDQLWRRSHENRSSHGTWSHRVGLVRMLQACCKQVCTFATYEPRRNAPLAREHWKGRMSAMWCCGAGPSVVSHSLSLSLSLCLRCRFKEHIGARPRLKEQPLRNNPCGQRLREQRSQHAAAVRVEPPKEYEISLAPASPLETTCKRSLTNPPEHEAEMW